MAVWQNVTGIEDGDNVSAEVFNIPIGQLAERTVYLKDILESLKLGDKSSVRIQVPLAEGTNAPVVGDVVCVDPETKKFGKAIASMSLYDAYTASVKAFAIGLLVRKTSASEGTVALYGMVDLQSNDFDMDQMVDNGIFTTGEYYLSSTVPGKITMYPTGPRILIGFFARSKLINSKYSGTFALVNPQHMDIEAHAHRTFKLLSRPAGQSRLEGNKVVVEGYLPDAYYASDAPSSDGVPRLSVVGDWTADYADNYRVVLTPTVGGTPRKWQWPVSVSWENESGKESGDGTLRFFGDSVAIGGNGLRVRIDKSGSLTEEYPFATPDDEGFDIDAATADASLRTWTVGRFSGRGWAQAGACESITLRDSTRDDPTPPILRLSGVGSRIVSNLVYLVPDKIFCLTELGEPQEGATLTIDGETFTFTKDADKTGDEYIQILDNGQDFFDTYVQLCSRLDTAFYDARETMRQVMVGASSISYTGFAGTSDVVYDNAGKTNPVALIGYEDGESLAGGSPATTGTVYATLKPYEDYQVETLLNGMDAMVAGRGSDVVVGDTAKATIYSVPGSKFRYAIEFDNDLKLHFPPVPARSGSLMLNGVEVSDYNLFGEEAVFAIGEDSIYWRDDATGRQPWPNPVMLQADEVDPEDDYRELFHFVSEFHSETGPVTSLRPAEGSPVKIKRCGTDEDASVGDLEVDVDLTVDMSDQNLPGYKVPKASRNGRLLLGPVVEKLIAGPGISFSRKAGMPDGQGTFTISADGAAYAGDFETVALENAKLESIGMFPYIRMLKWSRGSSSNVPTAFVAKFHVPATIRDAVYRVKFYASVFGETSYSESSAIQVAGVKMNYNILPDFTPTGLSTDETANLKDGLIAPDESFSLAIPFGTLDVETNTYSYDAYDPMLIHNDTTIASRRGNNERVIDHAIPSPDDCGRYIAAHGITTTFGVRPGYTIAIRFSRADMPPSEDGEEYTGAIGFLNLRWSIEEVSTVDSGEISNLDEVVKDTVMSLRNVAGQYDKMEKVYDIVTILTKVLEALRN